ncbi:hypothetical protein SAMN05216326_11176 [Nitrosomonas marina]|uniref:Uncharacterized protein n=1 Tax=Nitrosomonas marina TaxID=917 RepID=A0A1I0BP60_9PROT|nr:hypothetical protein SAMN05216326_11176 [Nitrosomonas marina]
MPYLLTDTLTDCLRLILPEDSSRLFSTPVAAIFRVSPWRSESVSHGFDNASVGKPAWGSRIPCRFGIFFVIKCCTQRRLKAPRGYPQQLGHTRNPSRCPVYSVLEGLHA